MPARIESWGSYFPPNQVTTQEILDGCRNKVSFPLERLTGIKNRAVSLKEDAFDLAYLAALSNLRCSHVGPSNIDMVIFCSISRFREMSCDFAIEPSISYELKKKLKLENALSIDINNACSGMLTAIFLAKTMIEKGIFRNVLVVSGEFVTPLLKPVQLQIKSFMDPKLASLTVGDAGASVLLEKSEVEGFQHLHLQTHAELSELCIGQGIEGDYTGPVMETDSLNLTVKGLEPGVRSFLNSLKEYGWVDTQQKKMDLDWVIPHQSSMTTIRDMIKFSNQILGWQAFHSENTVFNLMNRGNTGSTTHVVAATDLQRDGQFKEKSRLGFAISGSGLVTGAGLYEMKTLPRLGLGSETLSNASDIFDSKTNPIFVSMECPHPLQIRDAVFLADKEDQMCTTDTGAEAVRELRKSSSKGIDYLIYTGIFRSDLIYEPAIATLITKRSQVNCSSGFFAFDWEGGSVGALKACASLATGILKKSDSVLLVNSDGIWKKHLHGKSSPILNTSSAMRLDLAEGNESGFLKFCFSESNEPPFTSKFCHDEKKYFFESTRNESHLSLGIPQLVFLKKVLAHWSLSISDVDNFVFLDLDRRGVSKIEKSLNLKSRQKLFFNEWGKDLLGSGIACQYLRTPKSEGRVALFLGMSYGAELGAGLYRF